MMLVDGDAATMKWTTFELPEATVVVRPIGGAVCAYAFAPATPLGMVRLVVDAGQSIVHDRSAWETAP